MKIGVISDSHDRIDNLQNAIDCMKKAKVAELIHCGDFTAPFMIKELEKFPGNVHAVFGNIDDRFRTTRIADNSDNVKLHGNNASLELGNRKIGAVHFPDIAKFMATSGEFDAVFYGHTHKSKKEKFESTLLANPGEIMGRLEEPGFAIYDTKKKEIEFKKLK